MIVLICGTRPEWIKIKPVCEELGLRNIPYKVQLTGQHADTFVGVDDPNIIYPCKHPEYGSRLDQVLQQQLMEDFPQGTKLVLVQGDTTSALSGALAAFHRGIPVAHLEAGMRTYDYVPYPEEFNRRMIAIIASIHLCATDANKNNLESEKIFGNKIVVGNTVLDNLKHIDYTIADKRYVPITLHRRETRMNFTEWLDSIEQAAEKFKQYQFILIQHPNHPIYKLSHRIESRTAMGHNEIIRFLAGASFVITDSGGIQEELTYMRKKFIVARNSTERPEGINLGFGTMCHNPSHLYNSIQRIQKLVIPEIPSPYGDGNAAKKVVDILQNYI